MKKIYCYSNGKITTLDKVNINPYDIGFLRGYGVFDVMCTQNKKPFLLEEHWKRLVDSAKELGLKLPIKKEVYKKVVQDLLKLNNFQKSNIRTVLSGGPSHNGFTYQSGNETFIILIEDFKDLPQELYEKGANAITINYSRDYPLAKITNYVAAIKTQKDKEKTKSLEIIFIKDGRALEASTSNFFIIKDKTLVTEKENILLGITRNLVIKLAKKRYTIEERHITEKELRNAKEVFITATNKDVVPITKIDNKPVGNGLVGKTTKEIMAIFQAYCKKY